MSSAFVLVRDELEEYSFADLMRLEREMAAEMGERPIAVWRGPRRGLIDHLFERKDRLEATQADRDAKRQEARERKTNPWKAESIRDSSLALLSMVQYCEDLSKPVSPDNRLPISAEGPGIATVGYPYNWVIDRLREIYPNCRTTHECLRWYCVKVKQKEFGFTDYELPRRRPRERNKFLLQQQEQADAQAKTS